MVIRRIREHVAAHNWFAVLVDVAIVVLGVFLGTEVSAWNERRLDTQTAAEYRLEIIENLRANEVSFADQIRYNSQVAGYAEAMIAQLRDTNARPTEEFILDAYQATQIRQRQFADSAYDEAKNAGLVGLVANQATRGLLASYYAQLPQLNDSAMSVTSYRDAVRSAISHDVQRRIRAQCGDQVIALPHGVVGTALPKSCRLGLASDQVSIEVAKLRALPSLEFHLTRRIADIDGRIGALRVALNRARSLRAALIARGGRDAEAAGLP